MTVAVGDVTCQQRIEEFLEDLHPAAYGWALTCCRYDRDLALDVLQSAYLRLLDGRASMDDRLDRRAWVFGVIRTTAAEHRRRNLARVIGNRLWMRTTPESGGPATPEELSSAFESRRVLRALLDQLAARQREVLHLVFYEEMTIEEAAGVMGISVGAGRQHYERGKTRLRQLMKKER